MDIDISGIINLAMLLIFLVAPAILNMLKKESKNEAPKKKPRAPAKPLGTPPKHDTRTKKTPIPPQETEDLLQVFNDILKGQTPEQKVVKKVEKKPIPQPVQQTRPKPKPQKQPLPQPTPQIPTPKVEKTPQAATIAPIKETRKRLKKSKKQLKELIVWREILSPPIAMRNHPHYRR